MFQTKVVEKVKTHFMFNNIFSRKSPLLRENIKNYNLISGFHRALLQSITFIVRLMHSIIQNFEFKIYVV